MSENNEHVIDKFIANRYRHILSADGGQLTISNERLIFNAHALNIDVGQSEIAIADIMSVNFFSTLGFIPNGLVITTKDGIKHKFVVYKRQKIAEIIEDLKETRVKFINRTVFDEDD